MANRKKQSYKKLASILFITIAIFTTIALLNQKTSWFNYASTSNTWTQNQRSLGIYILPLTDGRRYINSRIMGNKVEPAVWLSSSELINIIDDHHKKIIEYAELQSASNQQKAKVFPNVIPLWVQTYIPGYSAPRGEKLPTEIMDHIRNKGAVTMLDFKVEALTDWSNGSKDAWLNNFGKDIGNWTTSPAGTGNSDKGWPKQNTVAIRVEPEVNASWQRDNTVRHTDWSSSNYKNAVARIHDKLSEGIDSVPNAPSKDMYVIIHFIIRDNNTSEYTAWLPDGSKWDIFGLSVYEKDKNPSPVIKDRIINTVTKYVNNNWPSKYIWLTEVGTHFDNNNKERGSWLKNSLMDIQENQYAYKRAKVFIYSDYDDLNMDRGKWMLRGTDPESIATRYGELANKWKFQQDNIFEK